MLISALFVLMTACESGSDRHALTGPESARLVSHIAINPSWGIVEPDEVEEFVAHVRSGRGQTVSRQVTWSSSDGSVLEVDAAGRVIGVNEGSAALAASYQGLTEQITVDVKGEVVGLKLSHTSLTLEEGQSQQLKATYVYGNGAERPAGRVQWQSSDPSIIQIDSDGLARAISSGTTTITAQSRGQKSQSDGVVNSGRVAKVEVGAPTTRLQVGEEVQFWADIWDANGNRMQKNVQWSSSNTSVATVSSDGVVRGQGAGQATITAKSGPESGTLAVEVTSEPVPDEEKESRPGGVTTLSIASTGETKATLRFTEVDDGTGTPAKYEVRYALSPLGFGWGTATTVSKGTCAVPLEGTAVGNTLSCTVEGLQPSTKYDFQLVAYRGTLNQDAEFGPLSNIATGSTREAPIQVEVLPSGATLQKGEELRLQATVTDAYGNQLNKSASWSSTRTAVATVSASGTNNRYGDVTAHDIGDSEIRATVEGISGASKIRVKSLGGSTPNEPAGLLKITERSFDQLEEHGWGARQTSNYTIQRDGAAPISPSNVGRARYPKGWEGGRGPINTWREFNTKKALYHSFAFKVSSNWDGHASGVNKIFFVTDPANAANPIYYNARGFGNGPLSFRVQLQSTTVQNRPMDANLASAAIKRGQWHLIEVYMVANEIGRANGQLHVWIDGSKTHEYFDVEYWGHGDTVGWNQVKWNPTWGGIDDTVDEEIYQYVDHIYISGK